VHGRRWRKRGCAGGGAHRRGCYRHVGWQVSASGVKYRVRVQSYVGGFVADNCRGGGGQGGETVGGRSARTEG
jgi:hypothetical protein